MIRSIFCEIKDLNSGLTNGFSTMTLLCLMYLGVHKFLVMKSITKINPSAYVQESEIPVNFQNLKKALKV